MFNISVYAVFKNEKKNDRGDLNKGFLSVFRKSALV